MAFVIGSQIGTNHGPALATVVGFVNVLTADVDTIVIVRRDGDGKCPVPAVLHVRRRPAVSRVGPNGHTAGLAGAQIHAGEFAVVAGGPNNVVVRGVRNRKTAFAAAHVRPFADGNSAAEKAARAFEIVARAAK